MVAETGGLSDRARGAELAHAAEALLAEAQVDTIDVEHAARLAAATAILALYWEARHQGAAVPTAGRADRSRRGRPAVPATEPGA